MAAIGTTVTAEDLTLAGITGDLSTALLGLTWLEAKNKLSVVLGLAAGNEGLIRGGVTSLTINGRTVSVNLEQINAALKAVRVALQYASSTGGIIELPMEFAE